ncbi:MAG: hypothetical protein ACE14M_12505 [Terriglobales bacterium]
MELVVALSIEEIEAHAEELGVKLEPGDVHEIRQNAGRLIAQKLEQLGLEMLDSCIVAYAVLSGRSMEKPVPEALMNTIREVEREDRRASGSPSQ